MKQVDIAVLAESLNIIKRSYSQCCKRKQAIIHLAINNDRFSLFCILAMMIKSISGCTKCYLRFRWEWKCLLVSNLKAPSSQFWGIPWCLLNTFCCMNVWRNEISSLTPEVVPKQEWQRQLRQDFVFSESESKLAARFTLIFTYRRSLRDSYNLFLLKGLRSFKRCVDIPQRCGVMIGCTNDKILNHEQSITAQWGHRNLQKERSFRR